MCIYYMIRCCMVVTGRYYAMHGMGYNGMMACGCFCFVTLRFAVRRFRCREVRIDEVDDEYDNDDG
jgi:hypothetical protein